MGYFRRILQRRMTTGMCLVGALCCSACGDGRPPVYPVEGKVLVAGKPAAGATIAFHPVNEPAKEPIRPIAKVDEQGNFKLTSFKEGDGAPEGEYQVTVEWYLATRRTPREELVPMNYLPTRYGNPQTSQLRARVQKGSNTIDVFHLKNR